MLTDSFFQQGVTHDVCQDYALHALYYYGIISDGCSGAADSDWGSRLICKSGENNLHRLMADGDYYKKEFINGTVYQANEWAHTLRNLGQDCITATLGVLYLTQYHVNTLLVGDGVIGAQKRTGEWEIKTYQPTRGGCYYPVYGMTAAGTESYYSKFGGEYRSTTYSGDLFGDPMKSEDKDFVLDREKPFFDFIFPRDEYKFVFIGTDGLMSFCKKIVTETQKYDQPVSLIEVLKLLFDNMQHRPQFLRLQSQWVFKRNFEGTFPKNGWFNKDDVAVTAIRLEQ